MRQVISAIIAAWPMVAKRSLSHWRLLSTVIIGVLLSSTVMSGTVIYFDALRELALKNSLDRVEDLDLDILIKAERGPTTVEEYQKVADATRYQHEGRWAGCSRMCSAAQRPQLSTSPCRAMKRTRAKTTPAHFLPSTRDLRTISPCCPVDDCPVSKLWNPDRAT